MYLNAQKIFHFQLKKENDIVKIKKKKRFSFKLNTNKKKSFLSMNVSSVNHSAVWQAVG